MNPNRYVSINNHIIPEADAKIGIQDLSIQRGYGIFDFFKVINDRPIFLDDHLNRFFHSAAEMYLDADLERAVLKKAIHQLMEMNQLPGSAIKIILTGGYADDGYTLVKPNLIITQVPFSIEGPDFVNGLKLVTYNHQRQLPTVKTIDYLEAIRLRPFVKASGADDVLYHHNHYISECPRANFFIVTDDEIVTSKDNVLAGIIRSKVLNLTTENYRVTERNIHTNELITAKEAFITSTTKTAWPVTVIDGKIVGNGKPGKVTRLVNKKLNELILEKVY